MLKSSSRTFVALSILLTCFYFQSSGQESSRTNEVSKSSDEIWWFNISTSPIIFTEKPTKDKILRSRWGRTRLFLLNRSKMHIMSYELGCVENIVGKVKVIKVVDSAWINHYGISPGAFWVKYFGSREEYSTDPDKNEANGRKQCSNAKIAITKVGFYGGGEWSGEGTAYE